MTDSLEAPDNQIMTIEMKIQKETGFPNVVNLIKLVKKYSDQIPETVSFLDRSTASEFAAKFLKGQQVSSDLHAIAEKYAAKMTRPRKQAWAIAYFKESEKNLKTQKDKEAYVELSDSYRAACEDEEMSVMFKRMIENQRDALSKAHYFMRNIADNEPIKGSAGTTIDPEPRTAGRVNW
mgnify:CR=1 FL=1